MFHCLVGHKKAIQRRIRRIRWLCSSWPWPNFWMAKDSNWDHLGRKRWLSRKRCMETQQLPTHRKSFVGFRSLYLHFILAHSKGQGQGHANFDYEYLVNGDGSDKYCYCQYIRSRLSAFDWYIYTWPSPIIKFKVKNIKILLATIS